MVGTICTCFPQTKKDHTIFYFKDKFPYAHLVHVKTNQSYHPVLKARRKCNCEFN